MTDNKDSDSDALDNDTLDGKKEHPAQIPLLEDVIYNTSLPFPRHPRRKKPDITKQVKPPMTTDLFGGSPQTATSGPYSENYEAESLISAKVKEHTSQVLDSLVQEYSEEIVRRLRDELSALLDDLDIDKSDA